MPNPTTNFFQYVFNYLDHLGNVRVSYVKNPKTNVLEILEENSYFPFGLKHQGYNADNLQPSYNYKFGNKELQTELGLNMYDFGARNYQPDLGRWMNIDSLAEKMRRHSPYNYAFNNPVYFIDPDGMLSQSFMNTLMNSSSGTKWINNNDGTFSNNSGKKIDDEGNAIDGRGGADANRKENKSDKNGAESETDSFESAKSEESKSSMFYPDLILQE